MISNLDSRYPALLYVHIKGNLMPYTIEWKDRGVWWIYSGTVTSEEMISSNQKVSDQGQVVSGHLSQT